MTPIPDSIICRRATAAGKTAYIDSLEVQGAQVVSDQAMGDALYEFFNGVLGSAFERSRRIDLQAIGVPSAQLDDLEVLFSEDEVWAR